MDIYKKNRFKKVFRDRFFLRFHMSFILIATFLSGLLIAKLLLMLHLDEMIIRYPLTIIVSYLFFWGFIKLWLLYVSSSTNRSDVLDAGADVLINLPVAPSGGSSISVDPLTGGGGQFGGGGASGIFDQAGNIVHSTPPELLGSSADAATGVGESVGEAAASTIEDGGIILTNSWIIAGARIWSRDLSYL